MKISTVKILEKLLFWIFLIIALMLAFRLGRILFYDYSGLSTYGFGYLTGLSLAFIALTGLTIFFGIRIFRKAV